MDSGDLSSGEEEEEAFPAEGLAGADSRGVDSPEEGAVLAEGDPQAVGEL